MYESHLALGGKMVDFGGWALPVQYAGILEEHMKVRREAGLFDVSHMGEIAVQGPGAAAFLDILLTGRPSGLTAGRVMYSPMCAPDGGCVDDLLVYRLGEDDFLLVVNAANTQKDFAWVLGHCPPEVTVRNDSDRYAQIALQGPASAEILDSFAGDRLSGLGFFRFLADADLGGIRALVSRTGYTGEDGFEIYLDSSKGTELWDRLLEAGRDKGLAPAGLGARDTLRFEAALPLYGHELSPEITPVEAGLSRFVGWDKDGFIGKKALESVRDAGPARKIAGFEMVDRGIPRNGYLVQRDGEDAGWVTSGSYSPSLGKNLGMALVPSEMAAPGQELHVVIREKPLLARVVPLPFYHKKYQTEV